jgi:NAD(P)-dependent dehydrogenase (short-subunit alcohol dehydrogenase family)
MTASLDGRSSIITGASQGLGYEIAKHYVKAGANVLVSARGGRRLDQAADLLRSFADRGQTVVAVAADVSNHEDVARIVETALDRFKDLHILVNNAGVYGPKGMLEDMEWAEWIRAVEINLYGPVLMSRVVLPHFKERNYGKIIQLSGGGATNPLPRLSAYAASKAAVVRFAETLAEEVREYRIDVNSIAPGPLNTRLLDEILEAGPAKVGNDLFESSLKQKREGGTPAGKGAELAVFLGSSESDGITGKLLSAVWDPWESLGARIDELSRSDIYTLRRIVPKDRGALWDS